MIPSLKKKSIVSDVGSVKGRLVTDLENALPDDVYFVGAHPIAGTEKSGADNSFAELFEGAKCILTPTGATNKNALNMVKEIWKIMGSEIIEMDPHNHDQIMAAVSHLPHVIAYAITSLMLELQQEWPNILSYSGAGFRDFTRIASSHPAIWRDICEHNSKALIKTIERYETTLSQFKNLIKEKNWLVLEKTMSDAKKLRDNFYAITKNK
jgi:prephenate dehydrogenase